MAPNRPRGRKTNVTGSGKPIGRRGSGLGTGPVGGAGRGAGIGLAVCNEIMSLHGGTMDITSEVGKGTCVTVKLPTRIQEKQK